jgi:hypothetical protein
MGSAKVEKCHKSEPFICASTLFVMHMIYFGIEYIHNVQHGHNLQDNWLIKKSIIDCLISCH